MSRRFALIVNPAAGGGRSLRAAQEAAWELERRGADLRVVEAADPDHARECAAQAADAGEVSVAVGGDGLLGLLAGALKGTDGALAIVPCGRGNDFARVLGIPRDPAAAARLAVEGDERMLDVGDVNGTTFVGIASLGFDSEANRIANSAKLVKGNLVYVYGALRALAGWKHATFEVTVDGREHHLHGYGVVAANSKSYGGGMMIAPEAELDDGRLDVIGLKDISKPRLLALMPKFFRGDRVNPDLLLSDRGEVVEVRADRPITVYADGDPIAELPATIRARRKALRVVVPTGRPR